MNHIVLPLTHEEMFMYLTCPIIEFRNFQPTANITQWGSKGSGEGQFLLPLGIATDSSDNIYVVDTGNTSVSQFANDGTLRRSVIPESHKGEAPSILEDVEVDQSDRIYIKDRGEYNIKIFAVPIKSN